jgi:CRISPR-associated protein Csb2
MKSALGACLADDMGLGKTIQVLSLLLLQKEQTACGPLLIGDGRYLGLGLMAPEFDVLRDAAMFAVPKKAGIVASDGPALVQAARRALMALAGDARGEVPRPFSGHEDGGGRAASGRHEHVFIAACDHSLDRPSRLLRAGFEAVVSGLEVLRAGRLGIIALGRPVGLSGHGLLVGPACAWESRTLYLAMRHAGRKDAAAMLARDVSAECVRRGLPAPAEVDILECKGIAKGGGLTERAAPFRDGGSRTAAAGPG